MLSSNDTSSSSRTTEEIPARIFQTALYTRKPRIPNPIQSQIRAGPCLSATTTTDRSTVDLLRNDLTPTQQQQKHAIISLLFSPRFLRLLVAFLAILHFPLIKSSFQQLFASSLANTNQPSISYMSIPLRGDEGLLPPSTPTAPGLDSDEEIEVPPEPSISTSGSKEEDDPSSNSPVKTSFAFRTPPARKSRPSKATEALFDTSLTESVKRSIKTLNPTLPSSSTPMTQPQPQIIPYGFCTCLVRIILNTSNRY